MLKAVIAVLVLACVWVWVLQRAARHEARAEAEFPPKGQIIEIDGHKVHALVMGEGPDLVLLHGSGGNIRDLTLSLAPELAGSYRVILLDRPGHGYTERINNTGATIRQQAALLSAAARRLGAEKPIVLGHSYGGAVALAWAVYEPEHIAALIPLAAPSNPWESALPTYYKLTAHALTAPLVNPALTAFVPDERVEQSVAGVFDPDPVPEGYLDHFGAGLTLRRDSLRANALQRRNLLGEIRQMVPLYDQVRVPTEIVHGDADLTVGLPIHSEKLVNQIPGAVLTRLPGIGHMPQHAAQDEVIDAIHRAAERAGLRPAE
ncbi:alpha/beta hydrolase [Roseovarius faecimaris]|uniref:Alpha/beta hydrolase n=1 Tax=Roseovarius faecimaris TaxID=2494550 RepID=A0A6I6IQN4_9RHOB|nr:alpha/beta hydrolase [Roseovarius faecimaris]QGX98191.1 alpha/beta hydrolase [Roseovarius faecimaris]